MSETDAELLSEQISMALARLEEFRAHRTFSNDATESGDVQLRWSGCPVATPDDQRILGLGQPYGAC